MRVAYADPPYMGCSAKHYAGHPDFAGEVDHDALIGRLAADFPDGWALSLHVPSLAAILGLLAKHGVTDYRIGAWCKPWAVFKPRVSVAFAWEPVIWRGGRAGRRPGVTPVDFCVASAIMRARDDAATKGTKPDAFCFWLFSVLGLQPGDDFVDLYRGSGAVAGAWRAWCAQTRLFDSPAALRAAVDDGGEQPRIG